MRYELSIENRDSRDQDGDLDTAEACVPAGEYTLHVDWEVDDRFVLTSRAFTLRVE